MWTTWTCFPEKIPVFCARFLVDPAPQFSNILIEILRDMLYLLYTCDTQPTLPDFRKKPAIPVPPECDNSKSTPSTPSLSRKQQKKVNKSAKNSQEQSTGGTKKKQQTLFESSKSSSSSKRKAITPVRNELPVKREKTEEDSSSSQNNPKTVGQIILSMLSPQKQDNELLS